MEELSQIIYDIKTTEKNILVQLLSKDQKVLHQIINKSKGQFDDLTAGEYSIRVIIDTNGNREWDPGNYLQKIEPEKIFYVKNEAGLAKINLKTNWEYVAPTLLITLR
jgi:hypothetical protein